MGEFLLRRVKLIVDKSNEPLILKEDESLEDILIRLESISHRIDDIQCSLIKKDSSLDLDNGVNLRSWLHWE